MPIILPIVATLCFAAGLALAATMNGDVPRPAESEPARKDFVAAVCAPPVEPTTQGFRFGFLEFE